MILWRQVLGLTAVRGAVILLWVVYRLYLPELLINFGWTAELAFWLLIIESLIAAILEPLIGMLSDRQQRWMGTRLPLIFMGVVIAASLTIALPTASVFGTSIGAMHWGIIVIVLSWAIAMTLFNSPTLALLKRYSSDNKLPTVVGFLTLTNGLLRATKPLVHNVIVLRGPEFTFVLASLILLDAAAILRLVDKSVPPIPEPLPIKSKELLPLSSFAFIGGIGLTTDLVLRLVTSNTGKVINAHWLPVQSEWIETLILVGVAVMAIPAGRLIERFGIRRSLCSALSAIAVISVLMIILPIPLILGISVLILVISLSFILNGGLSLVLSLVSSEQVGLASGMYLGGTSIAFSLSGLVFSNSPLGLNIWVAIFTCLMATLWVAASKRKRPDSFV